MFKLAPKTWSPVQQVRGVTVVDFSSHTAKKGVWSTLWQLPLLSAELCSGLQGHSVASSWGQFAISRSLTRYILALDFPPSLPLERQNA